MESQQACLRGSVSSAGEHGPGRAALGAWLFPDQCSLAELVCGQREAFPAGPRGHSPAGPWEPRTCPGKSLGSSSGVAWTPASAQPAAASSRGSGPSGG